MGRSATTSEQGSGMSRIGQFVRSRTGAVVIGAAVLSGGLGVGAVAMASQGDPAEQPPAAVTTTTPEATTVAPTTAAVPATTEAQLVEAVPEVEAAPDAATVPAMTSAQPVNPAPAPAPVQPTVAAPPADQTFDAEAPFVEGGVTYVPAPDVPAEPLPGEPGYVG